MNDDYARWVAGRDAAVWSPHGIAALAATCWLDDMGRAFDGLPGLWSTDGESAIGADVPGDPVVHPGSEVVLGDLLLRAEKRDGSVMLRVLDPLTAQRNGIGEIVRAGIDPAGVHVGRFRATSDRDGLVAFELDGEPLELDVSIEPDGTLFAAFSDATSGTESYRFRFLRMPAPDDTDTVQVDLNRAYLPPCAFSDHYLCVFPSPRNRWTVPVRAGELQVR